MLLGIVVIVVAVIVIIVAVIIASAAAVTAAATLLLLSRPHQSFTREFPALIRSHRTQARSKFWQARTRQECHRTPLIPESNPKIQSPAPGPFKTGNLF